MIRQVVQRDLRAIVVFDERNRGSASGRRKLGEHLSNPVTEFSESDGNIQSIRFVLDMTEQPIKLIRQILAHVQPIAKHPV